MGRPTDFSLIGYRWNACRTITVSSSGPDIVPVVAELTSITGLRLDVVSGQADIEVGWGAVSIHSAIGEAKVAADTTSIVRATVIIAPRGAAVVPTLLRHEMAHALGVGHAQKDDEVMYPTLTADSPTDYQAGDLAALHAVGMPPTGCQLPG